MTTLVKPEKQVAADGARVEYTTPSVNLHQDGEGYTLEVEMPGVGKTGVEMVVEEGKLFLTGHRAAEQSTQNSVYSERNVGSYRRVFDLDPSIDTEKIKAKIEQGILAIHLPKVDTAKPRKISVS